MAAYAITNNERVEAVLLEVFCTSDDEEDDFKQHPRINGLYHCQTAVSDKLQVLTFD